MKETGLLYIRGEGFRRGSKGFPEFSIVNLADRGETELNLNPVPCNHWQWFQITSRFPAFQCISYCFFSKALLQQVALTLEVEGFSAQEPAKSHRWPGYLWNCPMKDWEHEDSEDDSRSASIEVLLLDLSPLHSALPWAGSAKA